MVNVVVIDRTNQLSNRCLDNNDSQRINSLLSIFTMYIVLHCFKEDHVSSGRFFLKLSEKVVEVAFGRWSFTRVFRLRPLTEDIFGVLRRWSLIGGGRLQEVVARGHSTGRMNYFI